jgi:hypothetical protein
MIAPPLDCCVHPDTHTTALLLQHRLPTRISKIVGKSKLLTVRLDVHLRENHACHTALTMGF